MPASVMLTAVSLNPLPPSDVLRDALTAFLDRHPRPSDVLRGFADMLDAGEVPVGPSPVHEHDGYLEDYREQVCRKSFRVPEETRQKLRALSFATGLAQTAIIRLALNQAASLVKIKGSDPDQMELFNDSVYEQVRDRGHEAERSIEQERDISRDRDDVFNL